MRAESGRAPGSKKLKEAARAWANGGAPFDEDNTLAALKKINATEQQLEEARAALEERRRTADFGVWPENWRAWELFEAMENRWDRQFIGGGLGGGRLVFFGLQLPALAEVERWLPADDPDGEDLPERRKLFLQLRLLESEALPLLNA